MGELRRFIKSNNIIMRLISIVLTVAILASAFVYFGDEKMKTVSAGSGSTKDYMKYIVQRLIDGMQEEFNILEIVPYKGQGEFRYYASDNEVEEGLEANQAYLETLYKNTGKYKKTDGTWSVEDEWVAVNDEFSSFKYSVRYNSSTKKFEAKGPDTFTKSVVHEYGDLVSEKINVNTVEANKITEADINKADLIIISTGTHDGNTIAAYRKYSGDNELAVYTKNGLASIPDDGLITYNSFEKVLASELPDDPDEPIKPEEPVITSGKVYFKNYDNWGEVYIYFWSKDNTSMTEWPGEKMTLAEGEDDIYVYEISSDVESIIFGNNKSSQTSTLGFPGFDKVYIGGEWVDYPIVEEETETDSSVQESTSETTGGEETTTAEGDTTSQVESTSKEETSTEETTTAQETSKPEEEKQEENKQEENKQEENKQDSEFAYISRDMSWSMCEKLLDYIIAGKNIELPDGTVVENVKTPVVIDNGGISQLSTDSNMYKMLLIYRMCGTDRWQELKNYISITDSTGKKYKNADGVTTVAIDVAGTGFNTDALTSWKVGSDNTIKVLFNRIGNKTAAGSELSAYRETEPFNDNYLTDDYWVYNGDAWIIPKNVDKTVTITGNEDVTKAFSDRVGTSNKATDILRYLLGSKETQIIKFSDKVRVLEIQPSNCFQYNTSAKKEELSKKLLRTDASCITVECVTPNALNSMTVDIASEYDLVIIGDNIGSGNDANKLMQDDSGKTIYNDRNLNGYIYLAFGDLIKVSTYAMGYLPDEYIEVPSTTSGLYTVSDANAHVWTKYLFEELTNGKKYIVKDLKNYYVTNKSQLKKNSKGYVDSESFYLDHYIGNTRTTDNDITAITRKKLESYVQTGNPIVVAESVYTADRTKLYPTSDMYRFASETLGDIDGNGKRVNTNVLKTDTIGSAVAYLGTKAPRINFVYEPVTYLKRDVNNNYTSVTENKPVKPIEPTYTKTKYTYTEGGTTKTEEIDGVISSFNNRNLRYKFKITGQAGKTYLVKLLVDKNNDGVFNDINSGKADDNNEVYYAENVKLNSRTITYEINSALADNFIGMLAWRIDIIELNENGEETVFRVSEKGYSAIRNEDKRTLKVLQLAPPSGQHLELDKGYFDKLMNAVEAVVGYDMSVTRVSVGTFAGYYTASSRYYKGNIDVDGVDKLKGYDMIVLGFADSYGGGDIDNTYGALDNLLDYMDAGRSVMFTHDTVSWRSTPNYKAGYKNSDGTYTILSPGSIYDVKKDGSTGSQTKYGDTCFNLTINFRKRVGMDKFGVTLTEEERYAKDENGEYIRSVPMYEAAEPSDTTYRPSYMKTDVVREIQGFNNWNVSRMNFCLYVSSGYRDTDYYWVAPYANNGYDNSDSSSVLYTTKKVVQLNEGPITMYPYNVGTNVDIAETHGQYFELDMEDEDIVVWYSLAPGSAYYSRTYKDGGNNYYIYSKNNITYSGAGHKSIGQTQELKLFVNTIVKAIAGGNSIPEITVTNGGEVATDEYVVYVNSADKAELYEIDFKAEDPDLISMETAGGNIMLVGEFSQAKVYWEKPLASGGTTSKLIKEYGAKDASGVMVPPLKNGIIQEILLEKTSLTEDELDVIEHDVEVSKIGARFKIEVVDSKSTKDTVYINLQVRDLFDMD